MRARFGHRHVEEHAAAAVLVRIGRSRGEQTEPLAPAEQAVPDDLAEREHRTDLARAAVRKLDRRVDRLVLGRHRQRVRVAARLVAPGRRTDGQPGQLAHRLQRRLQIGGSQRHAQTQIAGQLFEACSVRTGIAGEIDARDLRLEHFDAQDAGGSEIVVEPEFRPRVAVAQVQRFDLREDRLRVRSADRASEVIAIGGEQLRRRVGARAVDDSRVQRGLTGVGSSTARAAAPPSIPAIMTIGNDDSLCC